MASEELEEGLKGTKKPKINSRNSYINVTDRKQDLS